MGVRLLFLQLQISAAVIIILLLRQGMKRLPKIYSYLLWILVFGRLLCPAALESRIGFVPSLEEVSRWAGRTFLGEEYVSHGSDGDLWLWDSLAEEDVGSKAVMDSAAALGKAELSGKKGTAVPGQNGAVLRTEPEKGPEKEEGDVEKGVFRIGGLRIGLTGGFEERQILFRALVILLWVTGAAVVLGYDTAALFRVRRRLGGAVGWREAHGTEAAPVIGRLFSRQGFLGRRRNFGQKDIYFCDGINVPFTIGVFRPRIYLPTGVRGEELEYILCHEGVHIRRRDYLVKSMAFLLTALNWFNPFVWAAFHFMENDMEMSCDEKVVKILGTNIKRRYSQSLLNFAAEGGQIAMTPLTFGENNVKGRVKNVLSYKNARKWSVVLGIAILIGMGTLLFTTRAEGAQTQGGDAGGDISDVNRPQGNGGSGAEEGGSDVNRQQGNSGSEVSSGRDGTDENESHVSRDGSGNGNSGAGSPAEVYWNKDLTAYEQGQTSRAAVEMRSDGIYKLEQGQWSCLYSGYISPDVRWCDENGILYFTLDSDYEEKDEAYLVDLVCMLDLGTGAFDGETLLIDGEPVRDTDIDILDVSMGYVILYAREKSVAVPLVNTGDTALTIGHTWQGKAVAKLEEGERDAYGAAVREELLSSPGLLLELSNRSLKETFALLDLDGDGSAERIVLSADPEKEPGLFPYDSCRFQVEDSWLDGRMENLSNCIWAFSPDGSRIVLALYSDSGQDPRTILFSYDEGELREVGNLPQDIRDCTVADGRIRGFTVLYDAIMPLYLQISYRFNQDGLLEPVPQDIYELIVIGEGELLVSLPVHDSPEGTEVHSMEPQPIYFKKIDSSCQWIYLEGENGDGGWFKVDGERRSRIEELSMDSDEVFELYYAG